MDYKLIQNIIKDFESSSLTVIELETSEFKIKLQRESKEKKVQASIPHESVKNGYPIKSPLVGTFYRAPSPNDKPFVRVGQKVNKGDPICIIEAMKIMNEINAPVSGIVSEIKVNNSEAVGIDQVLMIIDTK